MSCTSHQLQRVPSSGNPISGFRCAACSSTFVAVARVRDDGEHTDWFAVEINPDIKSLMGADDVVENLRRLEGADPQPPLTTRWFYAGCEL